MPATISVVIPVFNGRRFLADAIATARQQTLPPAEIIVVDDGSTDESADVARQFSDVRCFSQKNLGPAAARNRGAAESHGEHLAFLDQDDLWDPRKLEIQSDLLGRHPDCFGCITDVHTEVVEGSPPPPWLDRKLLEQDWPGWLPSALTVRREPFLRTGGFDTSLREGDTEWFAAVRAAGLEVRRIPLTLTIWRVHESNFSRDRQLIRQRLLRLCRREVARRGLRP